MEHSNVMQMKPSTSYTIVTICTGYRFHKAANVKEEEEKKRREEDMHGIVYIGDNESRSFARVREREREIAQKFPETCCKEYNFDDKK